MAAASEYQLAVSELPGDDGRNSLQFSPSSPTATTAPPNALGQDTASVFAPDSAAGVAGALDTPTTSPVQPVSGSHELPKPVQEVLQSEIGVVTMLNRLKHSTGTAKVSGVKGRQMAFDTDQRSLT